MFIVSRCTSIIGLRTSHMFPGHINLSLLRSERSLFSEAINMWLLCSRTARACRENSSKTCGILRWSKGRKLLGLMQ